jgi:hypothetical protein
LERYWFRNKNLNLQNKRFRKGAKKKNRCSEGSKGFGAKRVK